MSWSMPSSPAVDKVPADTRQRYRRLRALNVFAGVLLAAEAAFMLLASNNLALPVIAPYLRNDPVAVIGPTMPQVVFLLRIGPAVAFFLAWRRSTICWSRRHRCTAGTSAGWLAALTTRGDRVLRQCVGDDRADRVRPLRSAKATVPL